jgi:CMP-2-keto-3-deoxyoctulosonic acid synthetase
MDADVFVNVQGDEPFVQKEPLAQLLDLFRGEAGDKVQVASLVQRLADPELIKDPNYVKVALALDNSALFFSRSVIPYPRDTSVDIPFYEHIGVYAFRKQPLMDFTNWAMTPLEAAEKVECLRFLEHGVPMHMAVTQYMGVEIDTPEDIIRAEKLMAQNGWV